jgi:broad specificity polyphosphatase/5'/3'-nucleotidase SurE
MRILIANDDGIYSPGIATLAEKELAYAKLTHPLD